MQLAEAFRPEMSEVQHRMVRAAKNWLFARCGEPYRIGGKTLRFVPGTRPVRLRYQTSENAVNRYDAMQLAWFLNNLEEGDLAVDVGANYGQCTVVMADRCSATGRVIAFEPNPRARDLLTRNFNLNPLIKRATIEAFACSDVAADEVELYHDGDPANSTLAPFRSGGGPVTTRDSFRVSVTTLDSYFAQRGLPEPRCVKIDTEGAEIRVLQGAKKLLSGKTSILCELHPYAWPQFGSSLQQLKELLAGCGRRMRYLDHKSEIADDAQYGIVVLERMR
jgi:FkbM family methyltransferase